jgi:hypothetical protein
MRDLDSFGPYLNKALDILPPLHKPFEDELAEALEQTEPSFHSGLFTGLYFAHHFGAYQVEQFFRKYKTQGGK